MSKPVNIEHPAAFYVGKEVAEPDGAPGRPVLLEAADLTTHAVCVGMTGSGKTGLGIGLLEEAALDGFPAIVIDPKGDLTNLLLTFPELRPADLAPWLNPDEAGRRNLTLEAYSEEVANTWRKGLARWGQGPERIARLKAAAEFRIYTPGSSAGLPISVVGATLSPPAGLNWTDDAEALRDRIQGAVSALLALVGLDADPVRSREHILLTNIIQAAWQEDRPLDLADLIRSVQKPPMSQLGVFDLEVFFPTKERMKLAMTLNTIFASPSFASWMEGEPLDPAGLLWSPQGRPRVSIFTLAHLDDRERLFFLTLLLDQLVAWMRAQPGSAGLRALLYFDELFGYLPPYPANPPTKRPLLTLLKQARSVGLGLVLATQNPVDLDYKALSNAGIWFVGRLQTEGDKDRLLDGLMGIQKSGAPLSRARLDQTISALPGRTFLLHNVHSRQPGPLLFRTRWVMSYLRGPLTRDQVRTLMAPLKASRPEEAAAPEFCGQCGAPLPAGETIRFCSGCGAPISAPVAPSQAESDFKSELRTAAAPAPASLEGYTEEPPVLPRAIIQYHLPLPDEEAAGRQPAGRRQVYEPVVLARASVAMLDQRRGVDYRKNLMLALDPPPEGHAARWEAAESLAFDSPGLAVSPAAGALFAAVPESMNSARKLSAFKKQLSDHLYINNRLTLFHNAKLDLYSRVAEDMADFQRRVKAAADQECDIEADRLKDRFKTKLDRVEERLRRERRELSDAESEYASRKRDEALSAAESIMGFFGGRRSSSTLSRASGKRRMTQRAKLEISESEEQIEAYEKDLEELQREMQQDIEQIHGRWATVAEQLDEFQVRPRRADVQIDFVALGWRPVWRSA